MFEDRETKLTLTEYKNNAIINEVVYECCDDTASEMLRKVVAMMVLQGYHDVSIHNAMAEIMVEKEEYFESIVSSQEWRTK